MMASTECWLPIPIDCDFTLANLPFGVADHAGWDGPHVVVAIGDHAIDCTALAAAGMLDAAGLPVGVFDGGCLNPLMALGPGGARSVRHQLTALLTTSDAERREHVQRIAVVDQSQVTMRLPAQIGDYVDFYSSEHHAANLGRILRPGTEPLPPNWKHLPLSYHGRSGTIVVSGTDVARPCGLVAGGGGPSYRPSAQLDIELELGTFVGAGSSIGHTVPAAGAGDHLFGMVLFNDWSARDIQAFEYQPLGPHLAKSFLSSVSPWVVTLRRPRGGASAVAAAGSAGGGPSAHRRGLGARHQPHRGVADSKDASAPPRRSRGLDDELLGDVLDRGPTARPRHLQRCFAAPR
jgi:fumarylacetoacetase